jgi:diguanylate cyclase (GGDEF)-like protein/hemerythrin-like metal-binding protein
MVLPEGTSIEERLKRDYPNLKIIIVKSEDEAIEYIDKKKADFTLRSLTIAAYVIKNEGHFNLKIAGEIPEYKNQLRMGITKQDRMLQGILNKGIASISEQDIQDAINNYIAIQVTKGFDYKLFFIVFSVFSIALVSTLYWLRKVQNLNRKLEASVVTDTLTGLKNRLFFNQRISMEIERFKRYDTQLSLLMIDIDRFKRINDTYGHDIGDEVLKKVSRELQSHLRKIDLIARWGGEEFIVLLPETGIDEALIVAEKLRIKVESMIFENHEIITISIGISMLKESETIESLIKRADQALYHAKRQGRNRSCVSGQVLDVSLIDIVKWDPAWNSGCTTIDQQHIQLLTMCNELINNLLQGNYSSSYLPELEKLILHVRDHFEYEEEILRQYNYSDIDIHMIHHEKLIIMAQNLVKKTKEGYLLPIDVTHFVLDDVIIKHLLQEDTKYFSLFNQNDSC